MFGTLPRVVHYFRKSRFQQLTPLVVFESPVQPCIMQFTLHNAIHTAYFISEIWMYPTIKAILDSMKYGTEYWCAFVAVTFKFFCLDSGNNLPTGFPASTLQFIINRAARFSF